MASPTNARLLVSSLPALQVRQMGWSLGGRSNLTAHLVSIALIQMHFILGGQFSGFNCINCRELRRLCKATMQASYFSQSTRYSKDSPRLLGNAENLGHHANAIILKCRLTMFRHQNHKSSPQFKNRRRNKILLKPCIAL